MGVQLPPSCSGVYFPLVCCASSPCRARSRPRPLGSHCRPRRLDRARTPSPHVGLPSRSRLSPSEVCRRSRRCGLGRTTAVWDPRTVQRRQPAGSWVRWRTRWAAAAAWGATAAAAVPSTAPAAVSRAATLAGGEARVAAMMVGPARAGHRRSSSSSAAALVSDDCRETLRPA